MVREMFATAQGYCVENWWTSDMLCIQYIQHTSRPSPLRIVDNLRVRGHPYNLPDCSTMFTRNHLLCVLCMVSCNFYQLLVWHSVSTPRCFFVLVGFSIFMCHIASHCNVMSLSILCAFVTHSIKRLLTYLLTYLIFKFHNAKNLWPRTEFPTSGFPL